MAHLGDSGKTELIVLLDKGGKGGKMESGELQLACLSEVVDSHQGGAEGRTRKEKASVDALSFPKG